MVSFSHENSIFWTNTTEVTLSSLNNVPEKFSLTLFQNLVQKKYEIRSFYLNNQFYSMAIFSQLDNQTEIDFRNYNLSKPNRTVPYNLPESIKSKLNELVNNLELTTCSIDLLVDKFDNYIFLECNPVGQFGMTSYPCNFYLEKIIAKYLISHDHE